MGELVSGEDSGLGGWAVRVCACVMGKRGACRALLWGGSGAWIGELCGNGELVNGEDSGLGGWGVRVCACACVAGKTVVSGLGGVGLFCGMMRPLAGMAQKSP